MRRLITITDTWYVKDGKFLVVAGSIASKIGYRDGDLMEFKLPDGQTIQAKATAYFIDPSPRKKLCVAFEGLKKKDIPIGSEVWTVKEPQTNPYKPLKKFPRTT